MSTGSHGWGRFGAGRKWIDQQRLSTGFLVLLSLPTAGVGFALSSGIATTTWLLSTRYNLHLENMVRIGTQCLTQCLQLLLSPLFTYT